MLNVLRVEPLCECLSISCADSSASRIVTASQKDALVASYSGGSRDRTAVLAAVTQIMLVKHWLVVVATCVSVLEYTSLNTIQVKT